MNFHPARPAAALARSAGVIGLATLASRLLGLARDRVLAHYFGAGDAMDAFNVASRIPNLLRDLFAEGSMSAAFVPTFTRHLATGGREAAWRLASQVLNALLVVTGAIVVAGIALADPLTRLYAGDYAAVPGKLELTVTLTRVMFPFLTLVAIAVAMMGMLNSLRRFFVPALSPATFNVVIIASAVTLVPVMRAIGQPPILAIAFGTVAGGLAQVAIQWPALRREGFRHRWVLDARDPGLREILVLMGPGTVGVAAAQINLFVNTVLATGEGTGAVSWLNYAFRLMYLPIGLFGVSIATAALPEISRHAALDELAPVRLADLVADRDLIPGGNQAGDVALSGVTGDARHRNALAASHLARCEGDVEHRGGQPGIVVEGLVEVAQPEEDDDVGILSLNGEVLAPDRRTHAAHALESVAARPHAHRS